MSKIIVIAAIGKNNELGYKNNLIWKIKDDMKFFKENTTGHHVLMGLNTYHSLPKLLSNRVNMVLSNTDYKFPNEVVVLKSIKEALCRLNEIQDNVYIIGGASIYNQFINIADEIVLTEINDTFEMADVYFPKFDKSRYKRIVLSENKTSNPSYKFVKYIKRD